MFKVSKAQLSLLFITDNEYIHKYVHIFTAEIFFSDLENMDSVNFSCLVCLGGYSQPHKLNHSLEKNMYGKKEHGV